MGFCRTNRIIISAPVFNFGSSPVGWEDRGKKEKCIFRGKSDIRTQSVEVSRFKKFFSPRSCYWRPSLVVRPSVGRQKCMLPITASASKNAPTDALEANWVPVKAATAAIYKRVWRRRDKDVNFGANLDFGAHLSVARSLSRWRRKMTLS